jgi:hypothetical protein
MPFYEVLSNTAETNFRASGLWRIARPGPCPGRVRRHRVKRGSRHIHLRKESVRSALHPGREDRLEWSANAALATTNR